MRFSGLEVVLYIGILVSSAITAISFIIGLILTVVGDPTIAFVISGCSFLVLIVLLVIGYNLK